MTSPSFEVNLACRRKPFTRPSAGLHQRHLRPKVFAGVRACLRELFRRRREHLLNGGV